MLNKDVFFNKMDELVMSYPNWKLNIEDVSVTKFWYSKFDKFDDERFIHMVNQFIDNDNFNPTISSLKKWDNLPRKSQAQNEQREIRRKMKEKLSNQ